MGQYDVPGFFYLESRFRLNPGDLPASYTVFESSRAVGGVTSDLCGLSSGLHTMTIMPFVPCSAVVPSPASLYRKQGSHATTSWRRSVASGKA
jgi:hypothetical protein